MKALSALVKLSAVFALVCLGLFALEMRKASQQLAQTEKDAGAAIVSIQAQLTEKGGLIDISKATMLHIDRAAGEAAIASRQQRVYFADLSERTGVLLTEAQRAVGTLDGVIGQTGKDLHGTSESVNGVLVDASTAVASLNTLIADPEIPAAIKSLADSAQNVDRITASTANVAATIDGKVSQLAHPSKKQRALGWAMTVLRGASYTAWMFK
jgi:hypothetical protein